MESYSTCGALAMSFEPGVIGNGGEEVDFWCRHSGSRLGNREVEDEARMEAAVSRSLVASAERCFRSGSSSLGT